jgi:hypothetical protein
MLCGQHLRPYQTTGLAEFLRCLVIVGVDILLSLASNDLHDRVGINDHIGGALLSIKAFRHRLTVLRLPILSAARLE